jgi:hypothetical protein
MKTFKNHLHLPVTVIDDSERMLGRLKVPFLSHFPLLRFSPIDIAFLVTRLFAVFI